MTLIVEDGTGIAGANAYVSTAYVDQYIVDNNLSSLPESQLWIAMNLAEKELNVFAATQAVDNVQRFPYTGSKKTYRQTLNWPRLNAVENNGPQVPDNVVPWRVEDATAEYALISAGGTDIALVPKPLVGQTKQQAVGDLSITYFSASERGLSDNGSIQEGYEPFLPDRLLYPLVRDVAAEAAMDPSVLNPATPFWSPQRSEVFHIGLDYGCLAYPRVTSGPPVVQPGGGSGVTPQPPEEDPTLPARGSDEDFLVKDSKQNYDTGWTNKVDAGEF